MSNDTIRHQMNKGILNRSLQMFAPLGCAGDMSRLLSGDEQAGFSTSSHLGYEKAALERTRVNHSSLTHKHGESGRSKLHLSS